MLSSPRKREPITTVSGIWVSAFARTTDQIAMADSRSAVMALLRNDVDDHPVGGVYDQQHLVERRVLVRSYRRYLPGDGCRQRVQRDRGRQGCADRSYQTGGRRRAAGVAPYALPQQLLLGAGQYEIIGRHQKRPR